MDASWKTPVPATCPFDGALLHAAATERGIETTCSRCATKMQFDADAPLIPLDETGEANAICGAFIAVEGIEPDEDFNWLHWVETLHKAGFYIARRPHAARTATTD